jgi:hypothetical protein
MADEQTVAVVGTGDMGSAVGGALVRAGYRVVTAGDGRGALSRRLAAEAGIEDLGALEAVVAKARLVLSIVPPAVAPTFAAQVVGAMRAAGVRPVFALVPPTPPRRCERSRAIGRRARRSSMSASSAAGPAWTRAHALLCLGRAARRSPRSRLRRAQLIDLGGDVGTASATRWRTRR